MKKFGLLFIVMPLFVWGTALNSFGQTSTSTSTATSTSSGNTNTVNITSGAEGSGSSTSQSVNSNIPRQAPGFGLMASGPCTGAGLAVSTVFGGGAFISSDNECAIREAARLAAGLGNAALANELMESLQAVKSLPSRQKADDSSPKPSEEFGQ